MASLTGDGARRDPGYARWNVLARSVVGSDGGERHWAIAMTLIQTPKLNGVDLMAWLTDVLQRVVSGETKANGLHQLLPWNWVPSLALAIAPKAA